MKSKILTLALFASVAANLIGCTTLRGTHEEIVKMDKKVTEFKSVDVQVTSSLSETNELLPELKKAVLNEVSNQLSLASTKSGKRNIASTEKEMILRLKVVNYNKVSWFSRMSFGTLAGDDKLTVQAEVIDSATQNVIGSFTANSVYQGDIFNNGVENVIKGISDEVVKYLRART
jgi:hypothetical protein